MAFRYQKVIPVALLLVVVFNIWYFTDLQAWLPRKSLDSPTSASSKEPQATSSDDHTISSPQNNGTFSHPLTGQRFSAGMDKIKKNLHELVDFDPGNIVLGQYHRVINDDLDNIENGKIPATPTIMGMYLQVSDSDKEVLKTLHKNVLKTLISSVGDDVFTGRGIVMTGGGKYFPMALTAIRWLRDSGQNMPVEVYMSDETEYEPEICEKLFPSINVECRVLSEIYGPELSAKLDSKYALKPMAILSSKFDDVYFMDADSYPLMDLDQFFDWEMFNATGMLLNRDYWTRFISPHFYDIAGIELGERVHGSELSDTLLEKDMKNAVPGKSTESGQIFIRKSMHIRSLLLAMYYNVYGPAVWFPLLMQHGPGEGDKDTYATAAVICNEAYYQTQQVPATLGYWAGEGDFKGNAMVQLSPITDYLKYEKQQDIAPQFLALHANIIKGNPRYLLQDYGEPMRGTPPLRQMRYFGHLSGVKSNTKQETDLELQFFKTMRGVCCDWVIKHQHVPRDWEGQNTQRYCDIMNAHVEWLQQHPEEPFRKDAPFYIDLEKKGKIKPYAAE